MAFAIETPPRARDVPDLRERRLRRGTYRDRGRRLRIALVNNMPDSALAATQRQFSRLLEAASADFDVGLALFTLDTLPRSDAARREIAATYRSVGQIWRTSPEAVIVTGAEPQAKALQDEPYWPQLTGLVDQMEKRTISCIFSCLAAHAVVLHRDRIARLPAAQKVSGLFLSRIATPHELIAGLGDAFATPHSRHNGLEENELSAHGYTILSHSAEAGVDVFIKETASLSVFLQGHPEYEADTLAREFRRDWLRFARRERATPPERPKGYFSPAAWARVEAWARTVESGSEAPFPREALDIAEAPWRANAVRLFANWLALIARRKSEAHPSSLKIRWGG